MSEVPGAVVAHLSWDEVERRIGDGAVGILPVGAACKEHGLHLPMHSDWLQAEWLAAALVHRRNVLVWPTVGYGCYPAFTEYPGSVSLSERTFRHMVHEVLGAIQRAGVRRLLILNTGISTVEPLAAVCDSLGEQLQLRLANVYAGAGYCRAAQELETQPSGGHADELETSILMEIDAQWVAADKAQPWTPADFAAPGPFTRDPDARRFSPAGVWGDPTLASQDKGRRLLAAMVEDLEAHIDALEQ